MPQELNSESVSLMGPFNESREIRQHKRAVTGLNNPKMRLESSKRIIRNLRPCGGEPRNQRRLSCVWKADQPHVGEQLQFQAQLQQFSRFALFLLGGSLVCRGGETRISTSAATSMRNCVALARRCEVEDLLARVCVVDNGSHRNWDFDALPVTSGSVATLAMPAAFGFVLRIE